MDYHSYRVLLRESYLRKVVALGLCWIVINFCFYGQLVIEAFHLSTKASPLDLSRYFLTAKAGGTYFPLTTSFDGP